MQVRIEDVSPVEKKLIVEVPWETVSARLGDAYRELGKGVQLKGFRKGKVPRSVLEQMYAPRVNLDVANELVRESFFTAANEHKLAAVSEPRVEKFSQVKKGEPFSFEAIVEVRGEVVPQDYEGLPIERRKLDVKDEAVEQALLQLQREHTELKPIEGRTETRAGDVLALEINGTIGEHEVKQPRFGLDLDDKEREPLPGLAAAMTGVPLDTKGKEIELDVPDDWRDEGLRGRKAKITVSIVDAREKDVPALDDEFAKDTGKGDTLADVRAALRADLEAREGEVIKGEARQAALKQLVKRNQITVAPALIERGIEIQFNRLRAMLGMQPPKRGERLHVPPELKDKLRPAATDEVRGQLVLEAIADKENVAVTDAELDAHLAPTARARNIPVARLRAEWAKDGRLDNATWQLRTQKVLDSLVARASITEVEKLSEPVGDDLGLGDVGEAAAEAVAHGDPGHVHGPDCDHDH